MRKVFLLGILSMACAVPLLHGQCPVQPARVRLTTAICNPTPTPTPQPTPTPTPTPTPDSGSIGPKYIVLAVTYAPPGSQSQVSYLNSTMLGTSTAFNGTFMDTTTLTAKVSTSVGFGIFGLGAKESETAQASTAFTQETDTSSSVAVNETASDGITVRGPSSSAVGLSHDADIIWVWLNPLANFVFSSPNNLQWTGFSFDLADPVGGMDILGIPVKYLNGHAAMPSDIAQVLARPWAMNLSDGSSPGLTSSDLAAILAADPFSNPNYVVNVLTGSTCTVDGRFCRTTNSNLQYLPPPSGTQPTTQTLSLVHQSTATQGQGAAQTSDVSFSASITNTISFLGKFEGTLTIANDLKVTNKWNTQSTQQVNQTASASITGPAAGDNYTGPVEFDVYQDNIYGTFMFAPVIEPTFGLLVSPSSQSVTVGGCAGYTVSTSAAATGFNSNVALSISGLPSGVSASFSARRQSAA